MSGGNLQRLKECLVELRLPTFREHHGSQAALATKESWSYPQYLLALSELEVADRRDRRIQKLRRTSKLPWDKSLTSLDRSRLPAECGPAVVRIGGGRLPGPSRKSTCVR